MKIVPVQPIGVEIFWDKIKPLIKKATDYSNGRHTVDTTKYLCETGMMQLWLVFKDVKNMEFAKENNCSGVEVFGRPGWRKIFNKHVKYKESYVTFETHF